MRVIKRMVLVQIGVPDDVPLPDNEEIDEAMRVVFDVISKEEFDTLDEHPTWDFLSARVQEP